MLVTGIEVVLTALGVLVLLSIGVVVTFVLLVRALIRRIRRSRAVGGAALRARARVARGPQRTVLALRVRLDESMRSGRAAVEIAAAGSAPRGEVPRLFRRVADETSVLDLQLRLMESETDAAVLAVELPAARGRVDQVEALVRRVRQAVASGLAGTSDDSLSALGADVDREVAALRAGVEELQRLNRRDGRDGRDDRDRRVDAEMTWRPAAASTTRDEGNRT